MKVCSVDNCMDKVLAKGMCRSHYRRNAKYGSPLGGGEFRNRNHSGKCDQCEGTYFAHGLCYKCYCKSDYRRVNQREGNRVRAERIKFNKYNEYNQKFHFPILLELFKNECAYCGSKDNLQSDHITSLSKGGYHDIFNVVPSCPSCNQSKGSNDVVSWYLEYEKFNIDRLIKIQKHRGLMK